MPQNADYRTNNTMIVRKKREFFRENGFCVYCGATKSKDSVLCELCRLPANARQRRYSSRVPQQPVMSRIERMMNLAALAAKAGAR